MSSIEKAFDIIERNKHLADFCDPIPPSEVAKAEHMLDVHFPKSYAKFIKSYGAGDIGGLELYGIIEALEKDGHGPPNGVWLTQDSRKIANLPHEFIVIADTGYGPHYVLDTSQMDDSGECPVYMWDVGNQKEKIADSFGDFLYEELKNNEELE